MTRATDGATKLPSFLWFEDNFLVFTNIPKGKSLEELRKKGYWEVNLDRGAQTQGRGKGGASALVRPEFSKWEFTVTIRYDENRVNEEVIKKLFVEAGKTQGLGAARPNRGLDHGQFEVVEFTDITEQYAEKQLKTAAM